MRGEPPAFPCRSLSTAMCRRLLPPGRVLAVDSQALRRKSGADNEDRGERMQTAPSSSGRSMIDGYKPPLKLQIANGVVTARTVSFRGSKSHVT